MKIRHGFVSNSSSSSFLISLPADFDLDKELTEENLSALKGKLENVIGKEVEIKTSVNPKILGGVIIRFGDKLIDGSVRSRLYKLKRKLMQANPA